MRKLITFIMITFCIQALCKGKEPVIEFGHLRIKSAKKIYLDDLKAGSVKYFSIPVYNSSNADIPIKVSTNSIDLFMKESEAVIGSKETYQLKLKFLAHRTTGEFMCWFKIFAAEDEAGIVVKGKIRPLYKYEPELLTLNYDKDSGKYVSRFKVTPIDKTTPVVTAFKTSVRGVESKIIERTQAYTTFEVNATKELIEKRQLGYLSLLAKEDSRDFVDVPVLSPGCLNIVPNTIIFREGDPMVQYIQVISGSQDKFDMPFPPTGPKWLITSGAGMINNYSATIRLSGTAPKKGSYNIKFTSNLEGSRSFEVPIKVVEKSAAPPKK